VLLGKGGYEAGGTPPQSQHMNNPDQCVTCHVRGIDTPNPTPANPVYMGHTFSVEMKACEDCHTDYPAADLKGLGLNPELAALRPMRLRIYCRHPSILKSSPSAWKEL